MAETKAVHAQSTAHDVTPREQTPLEKAIMVDWYHDTLRRFLGSLEAADALIAEVFTQARKTPKLYRCTIDSIRFTVARVASLRLNPALPNEVFLVPYDMKQADGSSVPIMTHQFGYGGLRKLALRSPEVVDCLTAAVCANDRYEPPTSPVAVPVHQFPERFKPRGRVEGYYAAVQFANGNWRVWPMSVADVEAHAKRYVRDLARAPAWSKGTRPDVEDGLTPFDKMGMKTCLRMLLNGRDVPLSDDVRQAMAQEGAPPQQVGVVATRTSSHAAVPLAMHGEDSVSLDTLIGEVWHVPDEGMPVSQESPVRARRQGKVETCATGEPTETPRKVERASEPARGQKQASSDESSWKRTLRAHQGEIAQMAVQGVYTDEQRARLEQLAEQVDFALSPLGTTTDSEGFALASAVLEWVDAAREDA